MEMVLASMDFWDIVDGSKKILLYNADPKVLKRRVERAMSIIGLNLADNQFAHIKSRKDPQRRGGLLAIFTRQRICQHHVLHMQDARR